MSQNKSEHEKKVDKLWARIEKVKQKIEKAEIKNKVGKPYLGGQDQLIKASIISILPKKSHLLAITSEGYFSKQENIVAGFEQGKLGANYSEVVDYFLKQGIDYKGQLQSCYTAKGKGVATEITIDPGKILGPVLSAEIGIEAGGSKSKELLLIAQRHPQTLLSAQTAKPTTIHGMLGNVWEANAGLSFFAGVKTEVESDLLQKEQEIGGNSGGDDPALSAELYSLKMEAKAGVQAGVSYKYQNMSLCNILSVHVADRDSLKSTLIPVIELGGAKDSLKRGCCDWINQTIVKNKGLFAKQDHKKNFGFGTVSSADLIKNLEKGCRQLEKTKLPSPAEQSILSRAKLYISLLRPFSKNAKDKNYADGHSFLLGSSHEPSGSAGLVAEATVGASAGLGAASTSASAKVEGLKFSGSYKCSSFRYQSKTSLDAGSHSLPIFYTQDCWIQYGQIDFTPIAGTLEASAQAANKSAETSYSKEVTCSLYNSMSYHAVSVYWKPLPEHDPSTEQNCAAMLLPGSGISFGRSILVKNLLKILSGFDPVMDEFYTAEEGKVSLEQTLAQNIADKLHVTLDEFIVFLKDPNLYHVLKDLEENEELDACLLEASFAVAENKTVPCRIDRNGIPSLSTDGTNKVVKEFLKNKCNRKAQSIRLRYRMQDVSDNSASLFNLGFKFFGTVDLGVKLNSIDKAGSEGIVDVCTVWMDPKWQNDAEKDPSICYNSEEAVPPTTLFCQ